MKYQNYRHYKLPITINPLEYGKLILQKDNIYILSITSKAIAILTQFNDFNEIKFYREGDLIFSYKDFKTNDNEFIRILDNKKFTFKNNVLIEKSIILSLIENILITLILYFIFFVIFPENSSEIAMSIVALSGKRHGWTNEFYNIENKVFTTQLFQSIFSKFWKGLDHKFSDSNHIYILFKIKYKGSQTLSIGTVQRFNKIDKQWYFDYIINNIEFKTEFYKEQPINSIIFSYGFKEGLVENKNLIDPNLTYQDCYNYKIPISMNPLDYGTIVREKYNTYTIQNEKGLIINFIKFDGYNEDILINGNKFMRIIDNKKFWFENKQQVLFTSEIKSKFISKTQKAKKLVNNFITLDIETFIHENILNILIPYLICFYDGRKASSFFLSDFKKNWRFPHRRNDQDVASSPPEVSNIPYKVLELSKTEPLKEVKTGFASLFDQIKSKRL
jgi:hypothetical protein